MSKNTQNVDAHLTAWITEQIAHLAPGDRLPTVRAIMARFGTAQRRVERALAPFVADGRLESRRGLGIVVAESAHAAAAGDEADLLLLYRLSDSRLARNLLQEVEARLRGRGISMLQVGYASERQAVDLLQRIGRFRACLIQLHFETLSIPFLAALGAHAQHVVIDGVSATGIEADGIGTNWREALSRAFHRLFLAGHRRIAFLTSAHGARQIAMARREYLMLCELFTPEAGPFLLEIDKLPGDYRSEDIVDAIAPLQAPGGVLPFTALIVWGVVEGYLLERALHGLGLRPGLDLSLILLGSVDFPSEHRNIFDTVGNSNEEKLDLFERVILARIAGESWPARTHYLPIHDRRQGSVRDLTD